MLYVKTFLSSFSKRGNYRIIDNNAKSFEDKINRVYETVLHTVGIPIYAPKFHSKYLLKDKGGVAPKIPEEINAEVFTIEDTYLTKRNENKIVAKIRKRVFFFLSGTVRKRNFREKKILQLINIRRQIKQT